MRICVLLVFLVTAHIGTALNSYMVLLPRSVRSGSSIIIPVHFLNTVKAESVTAKLLDSGNKTIVEATQTVNGGTGLNLRMKLPNTINWNTYRFEVTGSGDINFSNSSYLYGKPKSIAIFVQTDKAIYKPGDTVKYRIFAVNSSLNIIQPNLNVELFDSKGNKIDEKMGITGQQIIEGQLALSDMPPLGQWKISVQATDYEDTRENYYFEVKEYVLPKFEVTVTLPPFGRDTDFSLVGTVKAAYTFGKPVQGNIVLTVSRRYSSGFFDARAIRTEMTIDGVAQFDIPVVALKRLTRNLQYETLLVHANVTEAITGITLAGEGEIRYYSSPYTIEFFPNMPDNFKPGFNPYKVWIKVRQQDDRPPQNSSEDMKVTVTYFTDKPVQGPLPETVVILNYKVVSPFILGDTVMYETKSYTLSSDGDVKFDLNIPDNVATATIKAEYGKEQTFKEIKRFRSPGENYLKSSLENIGPLKIGDTASVKLKTNAGPVTAKYVIQTKGEIVQDGEISILGPPQNEGIGQIQIQRHWAPSARFVSYFIRPDGEIVADGFNFVIDDLFENKVTITFDQASPQQPKANITLRVKADKDSLVNVLAVDKSVKLLKEGNDITPKRVKDELANFGDSPFIGDWSKMWGPIWPWPISADDASDVFTQADLRVLTDANLYDFDLWQLEQTGTFAARTSGQMFAMSADVSAPKAMGGMSNEAQGQIRKLFPETWIWNATRVVNGEAVFYDIVPDTITEFVANAFALSPTSGLGVASAAANMTVFLSFFVNVQLPYSVVRGETAVIQANIFNYRQQEHQVLVRLQGTNEFKGITIDGNGKEIEVTGDITRCILVKSGHPTPVFFSIKPAKIGNIVINVRATIPAPTNIFDEIIWNLPVKAEGIVKEKNIPTLVSFQTNNSVVDEIEIAFPKEVVPDSQRIRVTVIGDIFGPSLTNLDQLIELPYGCGEQNMLRYAPSVFAAAYMRKTGRFDNNLKLQEKIQLTLRTGYQRQLLYQRNDGSFSAFGNADDAGSTWLTAFVMKSFAQAKGLNIVFIDPNVIEKAIIFISDNQNKDGSFNNTGIVSHKAMQGGSAANSRSLAAYILIAFQEVKQSNMLTTANTITKMDNAINSATSYLIGELPRMLTDYEKAIAAYALKLVNSPVHITALNALESSPNRVPPGSNSAVTDSPRRPGTSRNQRRTSRRRGPNRSQLQSLSNGNDTGTSNEKYWKNDSRALEIEIASYALLTYSSMGNKDGGLPILKWLVDKRNAYGGFSSTQDTVVALQALSEFATLIYSKDVALTVDINTKIGNEDGKKTTLTLNPENHDVLQYVDLPGNVEKVVIEAKGVGLALIEVNVFYNVLTDPEPPSYVLNVTTSDETNTTYTVKVCASFNIPNSRSNMAIIDIGVVSGFEPMKDLVIMSPLMKRIDVVGGRLIIYFDEIPAKEQCVVVLAQKVSLVAGVKPANVIVYSYYEPTERVMKSYLPAMFNDSTLCGTCGAACCGPDTSSNLSACGVTR